jgi:hypothetical protein
MIAASGLFASPLYARVSPLDLIGVRSKTDAACEGSPYVIQRRVHLVHGKQTAGDILAGAMT